VNLRILLSMVRPYFSGMKRDNRSVENGHPKLRHWLIVAFIVVVLLTALFAWNSAAGAEAINTSQIWRGFY
jgi:hypothetical protein